METPERRRCAATRKDGSPCMGWPDKSGFCPCHREGFREIAALGGRNKSRKAQLERRLPDRLRPVLDLLGEAIDQVRLGSLTPAQGSSIAALASSLCKVTELAEIEVRLKIMELEIRGSRMEET